MVSDPGEAPLTCHSPADMLTSADGNTSHRSKDSLPGGWPAFRDGLRTR